MPPSLPPFFALGGFELGPDSTLNTTITIEAWLDGSGLDTTRTVITEGEWQARHRLGRQSFQFRSEAKETVKELPKE